MLRGAALVGVEEPCHGMGYWVAGAVVVGGEASSDSAAVAERSLEVVGQGYRAHVNP